MEQREIPPSGVLPLGIHDNEPRRSFRKAKSASIFEREAVLHDEDALGLYRCTAKGVELGGSSRSYLLFIGDAKLLPHARSKFNRPDFAECDVARQPIPVAQTIRNFLEAFGPGDCFDG